MSIRIKAVKELFNHMFENCHEVIDRYTQLCNDYDETVDETEVLQKEVAALHDEIHRLRDENEKLREQLKKKEPVSHSIFHNIGFHRRRGHEKGDT